ncbi:MAG: methylmalonyl Co-A mutase-associated GTPase MeaB [Bacteroidales bacterium]|nr:methylmalonyl Co-A mutase-associated GTPase MeaB [Bacteroidales bacterium]MCF8386785.1 methylmalonyl Co-A mutase-associated GTPase MeaB [Bacteroidales bacterium]MCF8398232.1 methylmalonyl Co-A mutase-associated GTPase MeaB [Bacteroidales bacterium]
MATEKEEKKEKGSLKVNKGVDQPTQINTDALQRFRSAKKADLPPDEYLEGLRSGNRSIFSKAITLVESTLPRHQDIAQQIIEKCLPYSGDSVRVGITGVPGVGKSTFIEALGLYLIGQGKKIAVLAIDPSSERSKGSILGDKTRMEDLANHDHAFIRPSASAGSLGGVARKTKESIILCEAAGYDVIFVETVGVGQSETAVHSMVDFFLLLMLAGAGDELQGIKRGIMEMADAILINKAEGDNLHKARMAKREYQNALHLYPANPSGWSPVVDLCSALQKKGIENVWSMIEKYITLTKANGYFSRNRKEQAINIMFDSINQRLKYHFYSDPEIRKKIETLQNDILQDKISSYMAAQELLNTYFKKT